MTTARPFQFFVREPGVPFNYSRHFDLKHARQSARRIARANPGKDFVVRDLFDRGVYHVRVEPATQAA